MFMDSLGHKIQYCSLSILPMLNYRFNVISSSFFSLEIYKLTSKI